jgi:transcriptional regulator with PAS, ATPase and Fis domain
MKKVVMEHSSKGEDLTSDRGRAAASGQIQAECDSAKESLRRHLGLNQILGNSSAVQRLREKIDRISSCDVNVLISGESGTGKELAARAIHYLSPRAGKPFVPVNCGAIPETLFENELFGHARGAFTDARISQKGLVEEANGGTLFLDEIGAVSLYGQVKLLRLLQDKEFKPLGDHRTREANIRIIAATNCDLLSRVRDQSFRCDLYYRLDIVSIDLPPLRERKEDIPLLVEHFVRKYSGIYEKTIAAVSDDIIDGLLRYSWPGNIRELENVVQQLVVLSRTSELTWFDGKPIMEVEARQTDQMEGFNLAKKRVINSFERSYLVRLLSKYRGDMVRAAKEAGKSRTALWNLAKKHNLSPKEFRH